VPGELVRQPVGLFALDHLLREFQKPDPCPRPDYVYDHGMRLAPAEVARWLEEHPGTARWCPVTRKVLYRYFTEVCGVVNRFTPLHNGVWSISYEGQTILLKDSIGLTYLWQLIKNPRQPFKCSELSALARRENPSRPSVYQEWTADQLERENMGSQGACARQPITDEHALGEYRERYSELRRRRQELGRESETARADNDLARLQQLAEEEEAIEREIRALARLITSGVLRRADGAFADETIRVRKSVSKALHRVMEEIHAEHPSLYQYLAASVLIGSECVYQPQTPVKWNH